MDKDANNEISYKEFISSIRGEMSSNRKSIIKIVFDVIDKDGDGIITMTDIGSCFNPKNHPEVKSGRISVTNLTNDFFESFGTITETGYLRLPQFMDYFANIAAFEDDLKFSEMMKLVWLSGGNNNIPESKFISPSNRNYGASSIGQMLSSSTYDGLNSTAASRPSSSSLNYGPSSVGNLINVMTETDAGVLRNLTQAIILLYVECLSSQVCKNYCSFEISLLQEVLEESLDCSENFALWMTTAANH